MDHPPSFLRISDHGVIAQSGERFHGMEEVRGSSPRDSTKASAVSGQPMMQVAQRGTKNQGPVKSPAVEQAL